MRLSAVATMESSVERGVQPRRRRAFSLVAFLCLPSSGRICLMAGSARDAMVTMKSGSSRAGTLCGGFAHAGFEDFGDVEHGDEVAGDGQEALASGGRVGHSAEVEVGYVADVDCAEVNARDAGDGSVHHALDDEDGGGVVGAEDRAEDAYGIDDGELEVSAFVGDEVPGGAFGEGFRFDVGGEVFAVEIGPVGFVEGGLLGRLAVADGGEG